MSSSHMKAKRIWDNDGRKCREEKKPKDGLREVEESNVESD
ncbi:predicted protein [Sclerotinia sclerotiorum 1980 UF-70]|uniref:Uncharacterized protein n=1 Tax=Sclerotinia sclerotiorum (strain ATCC 18683 / 1980 / Ss-1) TaxID=665079 RepID=A7ES63_SCLS1|nr:predicted protein [Sclerotinia sclerotiorum 1980 UF-70]EDN92305.1 predicted protein [Sclerotinia sclerotiorum 1980 UF-70]